MEAYPRLGRRANILDSFTLPLVGIWIGAIFSKWLLHGVLVYICCFNQACGENTSQIDVE